MHSEIVLIVDKSGSMASLTDETIDGYNGFIKEQQKLPGTANVRLVLFNHIVSTIYKSKPLSDLPLLNKQTYVAEGYTALFDAIGMTITKVRKHQHKHGKPDKTILIIMTDGEENMSQEYRHKDEIAKLVTKCQEKWGWDVFFLGANMDAFAEGTGLGVAAGGNVQYTADGKGIQTAYATMDVAVAMARSTLERTNANADWQQS